MRGRLLSSLGAFRPGEVVQVELVTFDPDDENTYPSVCADAGEVRARFGFVGGERLVFDMAGSYLGRLADALEQPSCASCGGEGVVTVGGYSVNPSSGVSVSDPQEAHDEPCPECVGAGAATQQTAPLVCDRCGNAPWWSFAREGDPCPCGGTLGPRGGEACEWCGYIPAGEEHACSRFGEEPPTDEAHHG